jgi:hypothetical protein
MVAKVPVWVPVPVKMVVGLNSRVVPTFVTVPEMTNWPVMRVSAWRAIGAKIRAAAKVSEVNTLCMGISSPKRAFY